MKINNKIPPVLTEVVIKAPGRTCLFGDHQDYLGLPVITCAISRHITLTAKVNGSMALVINKPDIDDVRTIDISEPISLVEKGDHLLAAMKILEEYNCIPQCGYNIIISGNIAINAGTSSSSAVVITWVKFLVSAFGCNQIVTDEFISQIAYEAEVTFHGAPGGKMDQYSIGLGNILYLETGNELAYEIYDKPLKGLIIAESGIPKQTTGVLGELKYEAQLAIHRVRNKYPSFDIQQATKANLSKYLNCVPDSNQKYLAAAILNHNITKKARTEFQKSELDFVRLGNLMNDHHHILKEYLKLTVPKIDKMINTSLDTGALGAKIVGSGRGGSIVVLAKQGEEENIIAALLKVGAKDAYKVEVDPGARMIKPRSI